MTLAVLVIVLHIFFIRIKVPTSSMEPTMQPNSEFIVKKTKNITRGDIVVFNSSELGKILVKRLIGMPGDVVDIRGGEVFINGSYLKEDYVLNNSDYTGTFYVPDDGYLFLGDNRSNSADARYWDNPYIHKSAVIGKVILEINGGVNG